ncbi:SagB/ThcOx family dehydrogenase [bacterium]|nr:SagB/ThcOx family dehydrogenase [bacterium]RQV97454.1 MAG: SagB/ThcOx family dehydrogenase [bacterium]
MEKLSSYIIRFVLINSVIFSTFLLGQEIKPIPLMEPQTDGGRPLMQVLKERQSTREFGTEKLPLQVLSNLLWAAFGINRPESGMRTAPSAVNWQDIDIYVALEEGLYIYDAEANRLDPILAEDIRAATGIQAFVADVPVNLIYVSDFSRISISEEDQKVFYSAADAGFISQNVYLYCASEGLATVVRNLVDKPALVKIMKLRPEQRIILTQSVGYPIEE